MHAWRTGSRRCTNGRRPVIGCSVAHAARRVHAVEAWPVGRVCPVGRLREAWVAHRYGLERVAEGGAAAAGRRSEVVAARARRAIELYEQLRCGASARVAGVGRGRVARAGQSAPGGELRRRRRAAADPGQADARRRARARPARGWLAQRPAPGAERSRSRRTLAVPPARPAAVAIARAAAPSACATRSCSPTAIPRNGRTPRSRSAPSPRRRRRGGCSGADRAGRVRGARRHRRSCRALPRRARPRPLPASAHLAADHCNHRDLRRPPHATRPPTPPPLPASSTRPTRRAARADRRLRCRDGIQRARLRAASSSASAR